VRRLTILRFHGDVAQRSCGAASVNALVEQARERTLLVEIAVGRRIVVGDQPGPSPSFSTISDNE